jgi:hypothetical protein
MNMIVNRPAADVLRANQEMPMKTLALATVSALSLALAAPAFAMDCAGKKDMQNAEADAARSEKPVEAATAQTPVPAAEPQSAEVAAAPVTDTATTKN